MPTVSALWGQRLKWSSGTAEDLMSFGLTRLTFQAWCQQAAGVLAVMTRILWVAVTIWAFLLGAGGFSPLWLLLPAITITLSVKRALRIPYRDWRDLALAALVVPQEVYPAPGRPGSPSSWWRVLQARVTAAGPTTGPSSTAPRGGERDMSSPSSLSAGAATGAAGAAGAAGTMLPATGFGTAATVLLALSLIGAGAALVSLVRRPATAKP